MQVETGNCEAACFLGKTIVLESEISKKMQNFKNELFCLSDVR